MLAVRCWHILSMVGASGKLEWRASWIAQHLPAVVRGRMRIVQSLRAAYRAHVVAATHPHARGVRGKLHLAAFCVPCPSHKADEVETKLRLMFLVLNSSRKAFFALLAVVVASGRTLPEALWRLFEVSDDPPPPNTLVKLRITIPNAPNLR